MQIQPGPDIIEAMLNFFKNIGPSELIIVAVVIILLFGSKILVNLSRRMGESVKEIKKVKQDLKNIKEGVA